MKPTTLAVRISIVTLVAILAFAGTAGLVSAQQKPVASQAERATASDKDKLVKKVPFPAAKALPSQAQPATDEDDVQTQAPPKMDKDSAEQILKRDAWFYKQRASADGRIPPGARARALEHLQRRLEAQGRLVRQPNGAVTEVLPQAAPVTNTWTSIGPTPTTGGTFSPVTGRITTIAVDPSDSTGNTVLIGGAQGGIWRSTDAGNPLSVTWTAVGDQNASLAMGSIAFAPSAPATVYAGTGEQASIGFDIYYGAGVLKSTDHGQTWTQTCTTPSATCPFIGPVGNQSPFGFFTLGGTRISYISVNPTNANMVLVGAQTQFAEGSTEGVYCTDDGGGTWHIVPTASGEMSTFVGFTPAGDIAFAALGNPFGSKNAPGNGIYQATGITSTTTCSGLTFTRLTAATLPVQSTIGRIDIGISPNFATDKTIYASIANAATFSDTNLGVFVSVDGGTTWSRTAAPDICQQQCWYDNVVKVDPNGGAIAFFAGGAVTSAGAPNWVVRTTNTGGSWSSIIPNALGPGLPHVDNHAMAFVKIGTKVRMYLGNDGGIWRTDDAEATPVVWMNLNQSALTLSQFYPAVSIHPSSPQFAFGGTQDNGSQNYSGMPTPSWVDNNTCGDGTGTAIDNTIPSTVYVACNGLNLAASVVNGVPGSFTPIGDSITDSNNSDFVPALAADPSTANVLYAGTTKVYQSVDGGLNFTPLSGDLVSASSGHALTAISVAPSNPHVSYAAADTGQVFVATNVGPGTGSFAQVTGQASLPSRMVRDIAIDPADPRGHTAYAVFSGFAFGGDTKGHVFQTKDGGATWVDFSCTVASCVTPAATDLPNTPVHSLVIDPDVAGTLYAATDIGVYIGTCTGTPTVCTWSPLSTGLPRVAVLSLRLHRASRTLRAATHGRGMWDIVLNNFTFAGPHISSISPVSANAGTATAVSLTVNGNGFTAGTAQWTVGATTTPLTTAVSNDGQLTATVPTTLLGGAAAAQVSVQVGASTSNPLTFVVLGGPPTITSVNPTSAPISSLPVPINVVGTGFTPASQVLLNPDLGGTALVTTFTDAQHLSATVPAASFGSTNSVGVRNPPPGGGTTVTTRTVTLPTFVVVAPVPLNDNFANAINITATNFTDTKDSSAATPETNDPTPLCSQDSRIPFATGKSNTIWYKVTPSGTGVASIDTIGSSYDSVLSVWTGSGTTETTLTATAVACNDDINPGIVTTSQINNLTLTAGTTYFIMVSSFGQADPNPVAFGGKSVLNFSFTGTIGATGGGSFTIAVQSTPVTIPATAGVTTTVQVPITVHPTGTTAPGNISVTCSGLPPGVTCNGGQPLVIAATSATSDTIGQMPVALVGPSTTLTAMALPQSNDLRHSPARLGLVTAGIGSGFAALILLLLPGRKRLRAVLGLGLVCIISLALGCGGGGGGGVVVTPVATTTSVTLTPPAKAAGNFSFAVTVTGGSAATGSVQFKDGGLNLGTPVTLTSGSATFNQNGLTPVGTHGISASYSGDSAHLASSSGTINVTVTGSTTVTINAPGATSGNPSTLNVTIN